MKFCHFEVLKASLERQESLLRNRKDGVPVLHYQSIMSGADRAVDVRQVRSPSNKACELLPPNCHPYGTRS